MPWLLGLADREMGARRTAFRGRGWAIFALAGMVALWCWRWTERAQAQAMLANQPVTTAPVKRVALEPYPANPFRWHAIVETPEFYQTAEIDTRTNSIEGDPATDVLFKPHSTRPPKPPSRRCWARSISTGALGPSSATWGRSR